MLAQETSETHYRIGKSFSRHCAFERAVDEYRKALEINPLHVRAHFELAEELVRIGHFDEAMQEYRRMAIVRIDYVGLECNLGGAFFAQSRFHEASEIWRHCIELCPEFSRAHVYLGCLHLLLGDFVQGWRHYEWRFAPGLLAQPGDPVLPMWNGQPLRGATIVLYAEQGLGDALFSIRYVQLVSERGGRVVVAAPDELRRLFAGMPLVKRVIGIGETCSEASWRCPLMSLPAIFGTDMASVPAQIPYLRPNQQEVRIWSQHLAGSDYKIGVVWAGSTTHDRDQERSMPLSALEPLSKVAGVSLFSLQKGEAAAQLSRTQASMKVQDLGRWCSDMADTAAVVAALDLVVTVDTSIAHLAGAMGKPVWIMLPYLPDWRWLLQREDSPWYPTARLFRKSSSGNWSDVITEVALVLEEERRKATID